MEGYSLVMLGSKPQLALGHTITRINNWHCASESTVFKKSHKLVKALLQIVFVLPEFASL